MTDLERCDAEIAEILSRPDVVAGEVPAYIVTLGIEDWEMEKKLIMREIVSSPKCSSGESFLMLNCTPLHSSAIPSHIRCASVFPPGKQGI